MTEVADPGDLAAFREQSRALRCALAALTTEERTTTETAYFGELTHAKAAVRLNQPLGTVKTRIHSALHKLRARLAGGANER